MEKWIDELVDGWIDEYCVFIVGWLDVWLVK